MAQRQYQSQEYQYEEYTPQETSTSYQSYQASQPNKDRINELLFFVNIVLFSLMTVISSYVYLSLDIPVFLAFTMAIITGAIGFRLVQIGLKTRKHTSPTKKNSKRK